MIQNVDDVVRDLAERALAALDSWGSLEVTPDEYRILKSLVGSEWDDAVSERLIERGEPVAPLGGINVVIVKCLANYETGEENE